MLFTLAFILAALADFLTMRWHAAREQNRAARTAILSMLLESLSWAPILALVLLDDWTIALASILGSGAGTLAGFGRVDAEHREPVVESAIGGAAPGSAPPL